MAAGRRFVTVGLIGVFGLKALTTTARPFELYPERVTALFTAAGSSLPSGHAAGSILVMGYIAWWLKRWWVTLLAITYVGLVSWSRVYAGVHFPGDVVVGLLWGALLLLLLVLFIPRGSDLVTHVHPLVIVIGLVVVAGGAALLIRLDDVALSVAGLTLGYGAGLTYEARYVRLSSSGSWRQRVLRIVFGLLTLALVFFGLRALFDPLQPYWLWRILRYTAIGLTTVLVWPWLSIQIGLAQRISERQAEQRAQFA